MNRPPCDLAKKFLRAWLRLARPSEGNFSGANYSFHDLPEIPKGRMRSYAVVSVKVAPFWDRASGPDETAVAVFENGKLIDEYHFSGKQK